MDKQLPMNSLPMAVQERLNGLLEKDAPSLTPQEFNFLRGRRDYLTTTQRKFYSLEKPAVVPVVEGNDDADGAEEVPFVRAEAKERLKELGVEFSGNASNDVLKELLAEAEEA